MAEGLRNSGIDVVGYMPWGTHFCHFYESKEDLLDTLVPYFKAGLEDKEFCVWVIADPLTEEEAWSALRRGVPDFDRHFSDQSVEIFAGRDWYVKEGTIDLDGVINIWKEKLDQALTRGYDGMRVSGDAWLQRKDWRDFCEYEKQLNDSITHRLMTVLCSYRLSASGAAEILDVARNHQFALARRSGRWDVIETPELKQAKEEIKNLNRDLEKRVVERTAQLAEATGRVEMVLDSITDRFFAFDADWRYTHFNKRAENQLKAMGKDPAKLMGKVLWDEFPNPPIEEALRRAVLEQKVITHEHFYPPLGEWVQNRIFPTPDGGVALFQRYVTELKVAEEEQRKLASLVENSTDFIGIASPEGQVLFVNPAGQQMVGLSGDDQVKATAIVDYVAEEDQERFLSEILPTVMGEGRWEGEMRMRHLKSGASIPMLHHLFFIREPGDGRRLALATIGRDITSRKRAERTLLESERKFSIIFDKAPFPIILARLPQGYLVDINEAWLKLFGFTREQVVGKTSLELGINRDPEGLPPLFTELQERGSVRNREFICFTKDGEARVVSCNMDAVEFGGNSYLLSTLNDITEHKRVEEERRRSEAYLKEGQRLSHTGSWAWNVSTGELFWSEEHFRICGLDPQIGKPPNPAIQVIHPEDLSFAQEAFEKAIRERSDFELDCRVVHPDGEIRYVHSLAHPIFNNAGDLTEYVGTIIDTTERKLSEQALRQAHAELAHFSRVLTMGELTASIAHEINQPLGAIVTNGNASLRLLSRETPDLEGSREAIDCMISDAMRASEVIKRIRALLKKTTPEKTALDINETIRDVIALSASELAMNRVSLRAELAADLQPVLGDRVQLQQVMLNLILNSNEAMGNPDRQPRELIISSRESKAGEVTVAFKDTGIGVSPQNRERIFDAFNTTKEGGLGLGLSISRTIIEGHDGRLWTSSHDGTGATFQFMLPTRSER
jgi:PAS domain S-box-containing protein